MQNLRFLRKDKYNSPLNIYVLDIKDLHYKLVISSKHILHLENHAIDLPSRESMRTEYSNVCSKFL